MVLRANDCVLLASCHDEFRGPRSDYVRQGKKASCESKNENMTTKPHPKTVRTQATIKKVILRETLILGEMPPSQR
ncbi:hypothetical protein TNCV_603781 [Trichonephila clavipes]|nr:hypothetical protein TNCV_603781 [Trichonephila clavipes]